MPIRPWYEVERDLLEQGVGVDELFQWKKDYFAHVAKENSLTEEQQNETRDTFLYGNENDWELMRALKHGWRRGIAEPAEFLADVVDLGQKLVPGQSVAVEEFENDLEGWAEKQRLKDEGFQPSSVAEKVLSGAAAAPGMITAMTPLAVGAGAAVGAGVMAAPAALGLTAIGAGGAAVLTGAGAAVSAIGGGALGFGVYEAIRAQEYGPLEAAKAAGHGAALGAIMGGAGLASRSYLGKAAERGLEGAETRARLMHMGLAGGGAAALTAAQGGDSEDVTTSGLVMGGLAGLSRVKNKLYDVQKNTGIEAKKVTETTQRLVELEKEGGSPIILSKKELAEILGTDILGLEKVEEPKKADQLSPELEDGGPGPWTKKYRVDTRSSSDAPRDDHWFDTPQEAKEFIEKKALDGRVIEEFDVRGEEKYRADMYRPEDVDTDVPFGSPAKLGSPVESTVKLGSVLNHSTDLMASQSKAAQALGRNLLAQVRKKLGFEDWEETKYYGTRDAMAEMEAITGVKQYSGFLGAEREKGEVIGVAKGDLYNPQTNVIATLSNMGLEKFEHGLGHHFHKLIASLFPSGKDSGRAMGELEYFTPEGITAQLGKPSEPGNLNPVRDAFEALGMYEYRLGPDKVAEVDYGTYESEGIARYIAQRIHGLRDVPEALGVSEKGLEIRYKAMDNWFNSLLEKNPEIKAQFEKVVATHKKWAAEDPVSKLMSTTNRGNNPWKRASSKWSDIFNQYFINSLDPVIKTFDNIMAKTGIRVPAHLNPRHIAQALSGAAIGQASRAGIDTGRLNYMQDGNISVTPWAKMVADSGFSSRDVDAIWLANEHLFALDALKPEAQKEIWRRQYQIKHKTPPDKTPDPPNKLMKQWQNRHNVLSQKFGTNVETSKETLEHFRKINPDGTQSIIDYSIDLREGVRAVVNDKWAGGIWEPFSGLVAQIPDYQVGGEYLRAVRGGTDAQFTDAHTSAVKMLEDAQAIAAHNHMMGSIMLMIDSGRKHGTNKIGNILTEQQLADERATKEYDPIRQRVIEFSHDGNQMGIQFADNPEGRRIYSAVKYAAPFKLPGKFLDLALAAPKRMMVLGTTGANIGFLLFTNTIRDTFTRAIQTQIKGEGGGTAMLEGSKNFAKLWKLTYELSKDPEAWKNWGDFGKSYIKYVSSGVKGSSLVGADISSTRASSAWAAGRARILSGKTSAAAENLRFVTMHPVEFMRHAMSFSEDMNRFAEWRASEKAGLSRLEAWQNSADVTVDFKRMGIAGRVINEVVPFFNPSLQGTDKFMRTLFSGKEKSLKNLNKDALLLATKVVTIPSAVFWMMNKDEEWYKERPLWEKTLFWHVKAGDTVFKIPVPFEWGVTLGTLPIAAIDAWYNDSPDHLKQQIGIAVKSMLPYDFPMEVQAIKPAWESVANINRFTGIPIESDRMRRMVPEQRFGPSTPESYKALGSAMSSVPGTPDFLRSPAMIEHLTRGYLGSVTNELLKTAEAIATGNLGGIAEGGLLKRVVANTDAPGQSVPDFYKKLIQMDQAWQSARNMLEAGDTEAATKLLLKYGKKAGIPTNEIMQSIRTGKAPKTLRLYNKAARDMAEKRKEQDNAELTRIAQEILGR